MIPKLGLTRTVIRSNYALISPDSRVPSVLPGWTGCTVYVQISASTGAGLCQMLVDFEEGGAGRTLTGIQEWFLYVVSGTATLNGTSLTSGGYAFLPPGTELDFVATTPGTQLLVFRKSYELLDGFPAPPYLTGNEADVPETPFLGDPHARLKTLIPDSLEADMAVNIFTYDPGATLPFVESHVMEHGMFFLGGSGVYRLGEEWHPVTEGDAIWIAPYCPQWFIAAGPGPARYIYYKDVNRLPA